MTDVIYLYGFLPPGSSVPAERMTGLEERPVEVIELDGFGAAISRLPSDQYGEAALEERVSDLRWMAHRGLLHERVVTWFVDREGIIPVRFLTLHRGVDSLRRDTGRRATEIRDLLSRMHDRREWNLKITYDPEALMARIGDDVPEVREMDRRIEEASPGRRYLLQRRRDEVAREHVDAIASRLASALIEDCTGHTEDVKRLPLSGGEGSERVAGHAAFLVLREAEPVFEASIDERSATLAKRGIDAHLSGPWAPYRFVGDVDLEGKNGRTDA